MVVSTRIYPHSATALQSGNDSHDFGLYRRLSAVAAALERVEWIPRRKIQVIYNGVDGTRFEGLPGKSEIRRKLGLSEEAVYFVLCSRLDPIKWIEGMLDAMVRVAREEPKCRLLLVVKAPSEVASRRRFLHSAWSATS